ncbi:MAG: DUF1624 domain-containing protein [Oscillospiraceae bacterium]|nr:DUF1624 domain-containing protein [Oscillospiraceae bacterium]
MSAPAEDRRYHLVDALRGLALVNMVAMHALYDVNVVFGGQWRWALRPGVHVWQQYICWSFILIAGFSFAWGGRKNLRRGLVLNLLGLAITVVTLVFLPEEAIWFGILTFMGCAILLTLALEKGLNRLPAGAGFALCAVLFWFFFRVNAGFLGFGLRVPAALYRIWPLTPLGFPHSDFRSSDYFPLLPWIFLFWCGFYLKRLFDKSPACQRAAQTKIPLLSGLGRHTLWIYLLHQPLLMGIFTLIFRE